MGRTRGAGTLSRLDDNYVYNAIIQAPKAVNNVAKGLYEVAKSLDKIAEAIKNK